jgi:hypothetical protein
MVRTSRISIAELLTYVAKILKGTNPAEPIQQPVSSIS